MKRTPPRLIQSILVSDKLVEALVETRRRTKR
jgi:hypothetical protein